MNEWIQLRILSVTVPSPFVSERWEGAWGHRGERLNLTFLRLFLLDPLAGLCHQTAVFKNRAVCISRHTCAHTCAPPVHHTSVGSMHCVQACTRDKCIYVRTHVCACECVHVHIRQGESRHWGRTKDLCFRTNDKTWP